MTQAYRRHAPARRSLLVLVAGLTGPLGCGESPTGPGEVEEITELPRQLTATEVELIDAGNHFAFDLLRLASAPDSNLFLSPVSASMALGMARNGTAGETFTQMRSALGFGELPIESINASYRGLIQLLLGLDRSVEMAVGNSVWSRTGFPVLPSFLDTVRESFDAEAAELDFSSPGAPARINGWVSEATRGRIEEIVPDPIPAEVVMYLINAIYFKGTWTFQFDPRDTEDAPFHLSGGSTRTTKLMKLVGGLPYHATERFQAVDLPYGGRAFSMTVLLPTQGVGIEELVGSLDVDVWQDLTDRFAEADGTLYLPRFRMSYRRSLNDDLKALGMVDAFDGQRADFSRLSPSGGLYISKVLQKSWVGVDEEGTEAAAATSVEIGVTSVGNGFEMRVDRPFLFVLRERLSGTILFVGKVVAPPEE
ncbi:MAG: serpin family protein [Gemmatimonadota bacterium]